MANATLSLGTAIVWGTAGGAGVTSTLTLNNLASGASQMGNAVDLTANFVQDYLVLFWIETGTAPVSLESYYCWLAFSHDNTDWPGKVTGADAAYTGGQSGQAELGSPDTILVCTADANLVLKQAPVRIIPRGRYVTPVVLNNSSQAIRNQATPANNGSRVILIPLTLTIV